MVHILDVSVGPADRILFLSGPPPEDGTVLELCSETARELVLVECQAGALSMQVMRAYGGRAVEWPRGSRLRMPLEFAALAGGWWECGRCGVPVTGAGRGRHAEWHEQIEPAQQTVERTA